MNSIAKKLLIKSIDKWKTAHERLVKVYGEKITDILGSHILHVEGKKIFEHGIKNCPLCLKYNIVSEDYDTWNDVVSTLNHTAGFRKFADYQLESSSPQSLSVGISTDLTSFEILNNIVGSANLNCVYDFDLVKENSLQIGNSSFSDEIIFSSRILTDYQESVGNRVLSIDDISSQFNSNPRATRYSYIHRFKLSDARVQKYLIYVKDQRYTDERQCEFVTLLHNDSTGFLNQYAKVYSTNDLGSFDFSIQGTDGILEFHPIKYTINDYNISIITCQGTFFLRNYIKFSSCTC
jgi:hypothetical protein